MTPTSTMYFTLIISIIIVVLLFYFLSKPTTKNVATAPSILTGIGIFGTFLGVAIGLMHFDASDVIAGVPIFLSGIKLAFWSSVVGIGASLIHKATFTIKPLQEEYIQDEMGVSTVSSLKEITQSLNNIEKQNAKDGLGEFLQSFGEKLEAGLLPPAREEQNFISVDDIKVDEAVLIALQNLKEELAKNSADEQSIIKDQMQRLLDELKEDAVAGGRQSESLLEALTSLKETNQAEDEAVALALSELKDELAKNAAMQSDSLVDALAGLKETNKAEEAATILVLNELKDELAKNSAMQSDNMVEALAGLKETNKAEESATIHVLNELKDELAKNSAMQSDSLVDALAGLKETNRAEDETVVGAVRELNEELAKNSAKLSENMLQTFAGLRDSNRAEDEAIVLALKELNDELARNSANLSENILQAFGGLKEDIGAGSAKDREVSKEQMEALFAGLTKAAASTLTDLSDIAENAISQAKWQAANLAKELSTANDTSTKSMIAMLKEILGATEDANFKITSELAKLRGDVAADLKVTTDQSKALAEQLHAMTESYKASLISTVTDLKAQISKDMKANYNLIDTYTRAVADVTGTNQVEALERMEGIANIMQNVVQSSSDMSTLLHDNAAAMDRMQEAFTGTNEGSLGRFLLNMNQDLIDHVTSLQHSLDAQGSLGTLMQDMNNETNLRLKAMEKAFEGSVFEIKQLPQQFVKGMSKLESSGRNI